MSWWRPDRFEIVIIGRESGHISGLPFLSFRHLMDAEQWIDDARRRQKEDADPLTEWGYRCLCCGHVTVPLRRPEDPWTVPGR